MWQKWKQPKKKGKRLLKIMFRKKSTEAPPHIYEEEYFDPDMVEELVEEGSAMLSERLVFSSILISHRFITIVMDQNRFGLNRPGQN